MTRLPLAPRDEAPPREALPELTSAADAEHEDEPGPPAAPALDATSARRRVWAWRAVLLAGLGLALLPLALAKRVEARALRIHVSEPASVTGVALSWSTGGELVAESEFRFAAGSAPAALSASVPLAPGSYDLATRVERGAASRESRQRVEFRGDEAETTLHLR
ncbi:MAG: hypothetical protein IT373_10570 [Polyangiaceae bacterium]|nr:hypothetical protein [Polyangiaceae bacterium]